MKNAVLVIITLLSILFLTGCEAPKERPQAISTPGNDNILAAGSGSNLPITRKLLEAYNQKNSSDYIIPGSIGSSGAVRAVQDGVLELGLISRPLKAGERQGGLTQALYARVGIVIAVHQDVPVTNITYEDLLDILSGRNSLWPNGKGIVVFLREEGDSSMAVLNNEIPGFARVWSDAAAEQLWQVMYTDTDEARSIETTSSALGFTDTGSLAAGNLKLKPLRINGVDPTIENIKNGSYPLFKDLYLVFREPLGKQAAEFKDFVFSEEGEQIIRANGGLPLKGE